MTAYIQRELIKAHIADIHAEAERDRLLQAVRRARRARRHAAQPAPAHGALAHRLFTALVGR
jgi:hypothetical protein